jgi:hypothetical protein
MKIYKNHCINNVVIIDGIARSGKFFLGKLISGINNLEYFISNSELERILINYKFGLLTQHNTEALFVIAINELIYNRSIGRNVNMKCGDGSSVMNSFESDLYINRQNSADSGDHVIKQLNSKNRSSVFILHQSLGVIDVINESIPSVKMINIQRDPLDLAYSWMKRGWGFRCGADPLSFDQVCDYKGSPVPDFAINWADEYLESNEYDRVVKSIVNLTKEENNILNDESNDICSIYYDNLLHRPEDEMHKIYNFIDHTPSEKMNEIIKREVRNNSTVGQEEKIQYLNSGIEDRPYLEKLLELSNNYKHKLSN